MVPLLAAGASNRNHCSSSVLPQLHGDRNNDILEVVHTATSARVPNNADTTSSTMDLSWEHIFYLMSWTLLATLIDFNFKKSIRKTRRVFALKWNIFTPFFHKQRMKKGNVQGRKQTVKKETRSVRIEASGSQSGSLLIFILKTSWSKR